MPAASSVVTCFLRNRGEILLCLRAPDAGTYPGKWAAISGYVEHEDPLDTARMEIREETALTDFELARRGEPFSFEDDDLDREWTVHPFLFDAGSREVRTNEEIARREWTAPTEIRRRETIPELWTSYDRVRPTPETVAADDDHGAAYISIRALETLRDEAALAVHEGTEFESVRRVGESLLDARPSMAVLRNRVNRVMAEVETPAAVERAATEGIDRALRADEEAASTAADVIEGKQVLTISRSGTVLSSLREAEPEVVIAESRPAREGVGVAEELARAGLDVTLCIDAAPAHLLSGMGEDEVGRIDAVLVGADTVLPDGRVVNKTGTRAVALAADREGVPVYVVAASEKISPDPKPHLESGSPEAVYDGSAEVDAVNPTFDVTPAACVTAVLTERGRLDGEEIEGVAEEHRSLAGWAD